ncbi:MAG: CbtB-domain containing protein, partial [Gluconacetobacter diazotrophicus]|nr:CbtB-domain containing protein [Gluconacetobacter diazotrophicus]
MTAAADAVSRPSDRTAFRHAAPIPLRAVLPWAAFGPLLGALLLYFV